MHNVSSLQTKLAYIALTEQENIGLLCGDKIGFVRPNHLNFILIIDNHCVNIRIVAYIIMYVSTWSLIYHITVNCSYIGTLSAWGNIKNKATKGCLVT